jgi:hypothetical protein
MKTCYRIALVALLAAGVIYGCQNASDLPDTQDGSLAPQFSIAAGHDQLSDIDIPLADGTGIVAAGVGLRGNPGDVQPGTINIDVPGEVMQVLVYWEGQMATAVGDGEINVGGYTVTGALIGGATEFFGGAWSSVYRADITALGLIGSGANSVDVSGMDYNRGCDDCRNNGVGMLVVYDDGGDLVDITIKDGLDLAYYMFDPPLDTTVPQTFTFAAADEDRVADLVMFAASVAPNRPNVVVVTIDGSEQRFVDPFYNADGPDFDSAEVPVAVPAGATSLTVQALSEADPSSELDGLPASLAWMVAGLAIRPPQVLGCRVTGGMIDESGNCVECPDGSSGMNTFTCGGQAGANTAMPPQPSGNWTHSNKKGPAGKFTFHGGTPSAPEGTEIAWIECMDPGWCVQARQAPAKQIDFGGVGTFKNMQPNVPDEIADHVVVGTSLHYFTVNIDDGGEPGKAGKQDPPADHCPPDGFGVLGSVELVDCECPDFYRIMIHAGPTADSPVIYEASGWIKGGNFQIHPPTGFDLN